jgi:glycosyltransferase involved in cell wall biosynthesis
VLTLERYHVVAHLHRRMRGVPFVGRWNAERWATQRVEAAAARRLRRDPPPGLVHVFEGSALEILRAAHDRDIPSILDVNSAFEEYARYVQEEGGRFDLSIYPRLRAERQLADTILVPSPFVEQSLIKHGVPPHRIVTIPFGVVERQFAPRTEQRDPATFRGVFVGPIGLRKGVRYLLEAWRRLAIPNGELLLVGWLEERGREILDEYEGLYRWIPGVPKYELQRWYAESDVFLFPTLAEGSALVSYEAMAAALPIVTTSNCGSVARDGLDGFIVPPRDVDGLCAAISALHEDPVRRRAMGESAREHVLANFTWSHYRARIGALYQEAAAASRIPDSVAM